MPDRQVDPKFQTPYIGNINPEWNPDFYDQAPDLAPTPSAGDTSLDTQETTQQSINGSDYRRFLLSGQASKALYIEELYRELDVTEFKNRTSTLLQCRSQAYFYQHRESGEIRVGASSCGLRWCPLCSRSKAFTITANVREWLQAQKNPRFLTLTLKHNDEPLADQIDRIYTHFKNLRRHPWFKSKVQGGIWFFQIVKSKKTGCWHPHVHCLVVGSYVDQKKLSERWEIITHDSPIVDIRKVGDVQKAAEYVARYAATPCNVAKLAQADALELMQAMNGRRSCGTWGAAKVCKLSKKPEFDADAWECIGSFWEIYNYRESCEEYNDVFCHWQEGRPLEYRLKSGQDPGATEDLRPEEEPETFKQTQLNLF